MTNQPSELRAGSPLAVQTSKFGNLAELAGVVGTGFNLIFRPAKQMEKPFFLQVNATKETLTFNPVHAQIPDRGSVQDDIELFTIPYVQRVSDAATNGLLHVESGMWINVPASTDPSQPPTIARLATIPHGNSVLAQGTSFVVPKPEIPTLDPTPFVTATKKAVPLNYFSPSAEVFPPGFSFANPNAALQAALEGQTISSSVVLEVSTNSRLGRDNLTGPPFGGGILNIPFVTTNADTVSVEAIFWIETVVPADGGRPFLQLQYTQTVILNFGEVSWPHVSVATLIKN